MRFLFGFLFCFLIQDGGLNAQTREGGQLVPIVILGEDTFLTCTLQEVVVVSLRSFKSQADQHRFDKLKKNVIAVYPYAKEAGTIFREVNSTLSSFDRKKQRKQYMRAKERELDQLYEHSLKNLTVTQGEILMKLIARETDISVYQLISEFKNPTSAFYWNKMSGLYGYSLKYTYDPQEERDMEIIIRSIEGTL